MNRPEETEKVNVGGVAAGVGARFTPDTEDDKKEPTLCKKCSGRMEEIYHPLVTFKNNKPFAKLIPNEDNEAPILKCKDCSALAVTEGVIVDKFNRKQARAYLKINKNNR